MTMTTTTQVLITGISLPACCRLQYDVTTSTTLEISSTSPYLVAVKILRTDSTTGLSYITWKCTSPTVSIPTSNASQEQKNVHSEWIPHCHLSVVHPVSPNANVALGRGPQDSKFENDNPRVELWSSRTLDSIGRFTLAKQFIHMGEQAFQALAFAVVIRQSVTHRRCHWCFALLRTKAFQCSDCAFARYCSRDCLQCDAVLHDFQCQALRDLKDKGCDDDGVGDVETVRLTLAVLSMEQYLRHSQALRLLSIHNQDTSDLENAAVDYIVEKTNCSCDRKHVLTTLQRVRCNAHPLYLDGVTCVGSGIFPEAAMVLNHSCLPNVAPSFNPRTRTLAFYAIADIPRGYAVQCAYIDLLQTRKRRQELLDRGFGFTCVCKRCTEEGKTNQDEAEDSEAVSQEETRVMKELMQLMTCSSISAKQRLLSLKKECDAFLKHNSEAQFALYTTEMQLARDQADWNRVIQTAEMLMAIWTRCGLPDNYHTTETLHMQIYNAAKNAGMNTKAKMAAKQVARIRQICGYSHAETVIK